MSNPSGPDGDPPRKVPPHVEVWLDRGWKIIPTERRGFVIAGRKTLRPAGKAFVAVGGLLLVGFFTGFPIVGIVGVALIIGVWIHFQFIAQAPTKFFPELGEKNRDLERT